LPPLGIAITAGCAAFAISKAIKAAAKARARKKAAKAQVDAAYGALETMVSQELASARIKFKAAVNTSMATHSLKSVEGASLSDKAKQAGEAMGALEGVLAARVQGFVDDALQAMNTYRIKAIEAADALLLVSLDFETVSSQGGFVAGEVPPLGIAIDASQTRRSDSTIDAKVCLSQASVAKAKAAAVEALDAAVTAARKVAITCTALEVSDITDPSFSMDKAVALSSEACDSASAFLSAVEEVEDLVYSNASQDKLLSAVSVAVQEAKKAAKLAKEAFTVSVTSSAVVAEAVSPSPWQAAATAFPGLTKAAAATLGAVLNLPSVFDRLFKCCFGEVPKNIITKPKLFFSWLFFGGSRDLDLTSELLRESPWVFEDAKAVLGKAQKFPEQLLRLLQQLPASLKTPGALLGTLPTLFKKISYLLKDLPQFRLGELRTTLNYTVSETVSGDVTVDNLMVDMKDANAPQMSFRVDAKAAVEVTEVHSSGVQTHTWRSREKDHAPFSLLDGVPGFSYSQQLESLPVFLQGGKKKSAYVDASAGSLKLRALPPREGALGATKAAQLWQWSPNSIPESTYYVSGGLAATPASQAVLALPGASGAASKEFLDYVVQNLVRPLPQRPYLVSMVKQLLPPTVSMFLLPHSPSLRLTAEGAGKALEWSEEHLLLVGKGTAGKAAAVLRCRLRYQLVCEGAWMRLLPLSIDVSVHPDEYSFSSPIASFKVTEGLVPFILPTPFKCLYDDIRADKAAYVEGKDVLPELLHCCFSGAAVGIGPTNQVNSLGRFLLGLDQGVALDIFASITVPVWSGNMLRVDKHSFFRDRCSGTLHHLVLSYYVSPREEDNRVRHIVVGLRSTAEAALVAQRPLKLLLHSGAWCYAFDSPLSDASSEAGVDAYHALTASGGKSIFGPFKVFSVPDVDLHPSAFSTLVEDGLRFSTTELFPKMPFFELAELNNIKEAELLSKLDALFMQSWVVHDAAVSITHPKLTLRTSFQRVTSTPGVEEVFCLFDIEGNDRVKLHAIVTLERKLSDALPVFDIIKLRSRVVDSSFDFHASQYNKPSPSSDRVPFFTCYDGSSQVSVTGGVASGVLSEEVHQAAQHVAASTRTARKVAKASDSQIRAFVTQTCRAVAAAETPGSVLFDEKVMDGLVKKYRGKLTVEQVAPVIRSV
ncbi:MAG: hypothetical protein ACTJLL_04265, partial [Anaplasma sp.]